MPRTDGKGPKEEYTDAGEPYCNFNDLLHGGN